MIFFFFFFFFLLLLLRAPFEGGGDKVCSKPHLISLHFENIKIKKTLFLTIDTKGLQNVHHVLTSKKKVLSKAVAYIFNNPRKIGTEVA